MSNHLWKKIVVAAGLAAVCGCADNRDRSGTGLPDGAAKTPETGTSSGTGAGTSPGGTPSPGAPSGPK